MAHSVLTFWSYLVPFSRYQRIKLENSLLTPPHPCLMLVRISRLNLPRDAIVHSAVLRLHVVRPFVRPSVCSSVCDVGGSGSYRLEILETNCTDN